MHVSRSLPLLSLFDLIPLYHTLVQKLALAEIVYVFTRQPQTRDPPLGTPSTRATVEQTVFHQGSFDLHPTLLRVPENHLFGRCLQC